jgi:hypothetical protein
MACRLNSFRLRLDQSLAWFAVWTALELDGHKSPICENRAYSYGRKDVFNAISLAGRAVFVTRGGKLFGRLGRGEESCQTESDPGVSTRCILRAE